MAEQISYREALSGDIPALRQLEQGVVEAERPFNSAIKDKDVIYYDLNTLISSEHACLLVAEYQGELIASGYARIEASKQAFTHEQHGYLGFMYVSPDHRGKGINQQLMGRLLSWCQQQGISDFYLDVYSMNAGAIRAYEKLGFTANKVEMKLHLDG